MELYSDLSIHRIINPLAAIGKTDLLAQVSQFCAENGLQDKEAAFQKGALVAQNPHLFEELEELTEDDKHHLRREITNPWRLPKALYFTIAVCSLGSAIQGWDNTGANGANLSFPVEFGIEDNTWLTGLINSAPTVFGLFSALLTDPLNNLMGRRGVIFTTGLFCVFPVLAQAFTQNWWGLLIARAFMGIGMGVKICTIPIMTSETVPAVLRGGLVMSFQLWVAFGIFIGFCSNLIFYRIGPLAWRFQLAAAFAPAVPILIFIWFCPESPRWLLKKQRYQDSFRSFSRLRNTEVQAARDMVRLLCEADDGIDS
jgi:MFS family permease